MKYLSFISTLVVTCALGVLVALPFGQIPPIAPLLDPNHGFWQNSFSEDQLAEESLDLENLNAPVEVVYDEQLIPHIYAENELDLYRAQGYITAKHRLWQMEFQTRAAAGRLSELVGPMALEMDRMTPTPNHRCGLRGMVRTGQTRANWCHLRTAFFTPSKTC